MNNPLSEGVKRLWGVEKKAPLSSWTQIEVISIEALVPPASNDLMTKEMESSPVGNQEKPHSTNLQASAFTSSKMRKYACPNVDIIFNRVFGAEKNKECLISFLSDVLQLQIEDLSIVKTEPPQVYTGCIGSGLDVLVRLKSGKFVYVDIEICDQGHFAERSLFYWAKVFAEQLKLGNPYEEIKPVYSICILNSEWFQESESYIRNFALRDTTTGEKFDQKTEYIHFTFLELQKFKETATEVPLTSLEKWILFLNTNNDHVLDELKMSNQTMAKAISALEIAAMSDAERRSYIARMDGISDEKSIMSYNRKKGRELGLEEVRKAGREKGRREIFLNMQSNGMPPEQIASLLDLEPQEVERLLTLPQP